MKLRKVVFAVCLVIMPALFTGGLALISNEDFSVSEKAQYEKNYITPINSEESQNNNKENGEQKQIPVKKEPVNFLLIGLDQEEERSDVIILLNYNPDSGEVNLLSVPRDMRVKVRGTFEKANALYAFGKETLLIKGVEQLTGLKIDYYLTLNFKGFRKIIDTLDGVEMNVPFDMDYDDPDQDLHIHLKKGSQLLNGSKAEQLVRYRKGNGKNEGYEDGDIGRIKMQQEFIKEFFAQKLKVKYLSKADDIFFILKKYMKTNIELGDIKKYLTDVKNINYDNIKTYTVAGESRYMNELWYFIADKKATKETIDKHFFK